MAHGQGLQAAVHLDSDSAHISYRYTCALGSCDAVWKAKLRLGCSVGLCADQAALDERKLIKDGLFRGVQGPKR